MISKTFKLFLLFFILYNLLLLLFPPKKVYFQNTQQLNYVSAEQFFFSSRNRYDLIITGSSMSQRLSLDSFPENSYNLSFSGKSAFTGLELIKKKGDRPKIILIEMNILDLSIDDKFVNNLSRPLLYHLKKVFPALLESNQPFSILGSACIKMEYMIRNSGSKGIPEKIDSFKNETRRGNDTKFLIHKDLLSTYSENVDSLKVIKNIEILNDFIDYYNSFNTKLVLFYMPVNPDIFTSVRMESQKRLLKRYLKDNHVYWIPPDPMRQYFPGDGEHLDAKEAELFSKYLLGQIEKINKISFNEMGKPFINFENP